MARLDHLVLATRDLEARARWIWDAFGLEAQPGGPHPGAGTANWYVPLGDDQYLELMALIDDTARHPMVGVMKRALVDGDRLLNFALTADDIEPVSKRLDEPVFDNETHGPGGKTVKFRLTGVSGLLGGEPMPWFVQTTEGRQWRGEFRPARHRVTPQGVARVEYGGDRDRILARIGDPDFPITVTDGRPGLSAFWVRIDGREVEVRLKAGG